MYPCAKPTHSPAKLKDGLLGRIQNINYYPKYNCGCFEDYFLTTSIDKKVLENGFLVYPNPITNESIISITSNEPILEVSIYNSTGSIVWSESAYSKIYHIGNANIKSGIYFISAKMQNGNYYSTKIIKP